MQRSEPSNKAVMPHVKMYEDWATYLFLLLIEKYHLRLEFIKLLNFNNLIYCQWRNWVGEGRHLLPGDFVGRAK